MTDTPVSLLGFEYQAIIDDVDRENPGRGSKKLVNFTSTVPKDCSQEELDEHLDKCRRAVDRQRVFANIETTKIDIRNKEELISHMEKAIAHLDKKYAIRAEEHGGRAERGLSASERENRQKAIENLQNTVAMLGADRHKLEKLLAIVDPATNSNPSQSLNGEQGRWADNGGATA